MLYRQRLPAGPPPQAPPSPPGTSGPATSPPPIPFGAPVAVAAAALVIIILALTAWRHVSGRRVLAGPVRRQCLVEHAALVTQSGGS